MHRRSFPSVEGELLFEVLRGHAEAMLDGVSHIARLDLAPDRKLERLLGYQAEPLLRRQAEMTIYERERRALSGARAADLRAVQGRIEGVWAAILGEGVRVGALRRVDPVVVKGIIAMVNSVHHGYRPGGRLTSATINRRLADFVRRGLAPASDGTAAARTDRPSPAPL